MSKTFKDSYREKKMKSNNWTSQEHNKALSFTTSTILAPSRISAGFLAKGTTAGSSFDLSVVTRP